MPTRLDLHICLERYAFGESITESTGIAMVGMRYGSAPRFQPKVFVNAALSTRGGTTSRRDVKIVKYSKTIEVGEP